LLELANKTGITQKVAEQAISRIAKTAERFNDFAKDLPIRTKTLKSIEKIVMANHARLV
jgi:hypothetical protein